MNLLRVSDLNKRSVFEIFSRAKEYENNKRKLPDTTKQVAGLLFFDESTRTRIGFEVATWKLGIESVHLDRTKPSKSSSWSETIEDTVKTLDAFFDLFLVRHTDENIFKKVTPYTDKPVINCGNGNDEHPTQALVDTYTIWRKFGSLDKLKVTLIGNLKYSRSARSLVRLLNLFSSANLQQIAPNKLLIKGSPAIKRIDKQDLGKEDVLYSAGFAPSTLSGNFSHETVMDYSISIDDVSRLKEECIIMNPLPRIDEIDTAVDNTKQAHYFTQNKLGLYVRMAIIDFMLRKS